LIASPLIDDCGTFATGIGVAEWADHRDAVPAASLPATLKPLRMYLDFRGSDAGGGPGVLDLGDLRG
jgi:hypothetical protein